MIGADVIRGAGFTHTQTKSKEITYDLIMRDIIVFVNKFINEVYFDETKMGREFWINARPEWSNEILVTLVAGFDVSLALLKLAARAQSAPEYSSFTLMKEKVLLGPHKIAIDYRIVLENAYLGYGSLRDLSYELQTFGVLNQT